MELDERKKRILESIIRDYVQTAEPVGSRAVVRKHSLNISAATVRNEMADLEEMGYLEQPHTSAGRIPSQMGLRYFVDCMMENEQLSEEEMEILIRTLQEQMRDLNDVIQGVGQFISKVTRYASLIIVPSVKINQIQHIQLLPLLQGLALLILVTDSGMILHSKMRIPESITPQDLEFISYHFNRVLKGKNLNALNKSDLSYLHDEVISQKKVLDNTLETIEMLVKNTGQDKVLIHGTLNILNEPEFKDLDKLRRVLSILEADDLIRKVIPDTVDGEVSIRIGRENELEEIHELSLVFAGFKANGEMGKIGLMGPVRMEYWKAAGAIDSVRLIIEDILKNF